MMRMMRQLTARADSFKVGALRQTGAREAVCRCVADFVKSLDARKDPVRGSLSRLVGP